MTLKIVQGYCKSFTNRNVIHVSEAEQVERNICSKKNVFKVFNTERVRFSRKMVKELIYLFHSLPTCTL